MATTRDGLYSRFRFLVAIGDAGLSPQGGFDEVSGLTTDVTLADHREGAANVSVRQLPGVLKTTSVKLKSGVIDGLEFRRWLDDTGIGGSGAARTVTIWQRNEQKATVGTWRLVGARIIKRTTGLRNASDAHVAIDELGLDCDGVEVVRG